jgi:hypothetical protein
MGFPEIVSKGFPGVTDVLFEDKGRMTGDYKWNVKVLHAYPHLWKTNQPDTD